MSRPPGSVNLHPRSDRVSTRRGLRDFPPPTPLDTPCRLWQGQLNSKGYGCKTGGGRRVLAHRWVWEQINGPIPEGMIVMHRCDHPLCYRYDHLRLGTHADNSADMTAKGRDRGRFEPLQRLKVPVEDVAEMRARYAAGLATQSQLGRQYGIHRSTVLRIVRGDTRRSG